MTRTGSMLALLALVGAFTLGGNRPVVADDTPPTPEAVTAVPTPEAPTVEAPTPLPTSAPEPTLLPTVVKERSTPVATVMIEPTQAVVQEPTATVPVETAPMPTPVPVEKPTAVPTISSPPASSSSQTETIAWPSPAQLRESARLRWGKHVPGAVHRWAFLIIPAAKRYHLDPNLLAAVMTMESGGDPLALSSADARGLMQILHGPWDPATNVDIGARMLSNLYAEFGDWTLALAAYNAGEGAVIAYGGVPPYRETRDYVIVVQYLWDLFGHRKLTTARKQQFRATLKDLQHFKDQRKKVTKLAHIGHVPVVPPVPCAAECSEGQAPATPVALPDPFWPIAGKPDPLQRVDPYLQGEGEVAAPAGRQR